ncbi:MAG TPA: hypothetical protein VHE54_19685 [Puia sp.]|nr:hypothetical protein [Puia sp.]
MEQYDSPSSDFHSILFDGPTPDLSMQAPACFHDLNLDLVVNAIAADRKGYALESFFYTPLHRLETILYRQEVFRDMEDPAFKNRIVLFATAMRNMRRRLPAEDKTYYKYQRERFFLEAVDIYWRAVLQLVQDLDAYGYRSSGLTAFHVFLKHYLASGEFLVLASETSALLGELSTVAYGIYVKDLVVQVRMPGQELDYTQEVERLFGKFRHENADSPARAEQDVEGKRGAPMREMLEFPDNDEMNHVEARILDGVASLYPTLFRQLDEYCRQHTGFLEKHISGFDREIQFYLGWLAYIDRVKNAGLSFCYPAVSDSEKQVFCTNGFDLALAHKLTGENRPVICNDMALRGRERIIIVSGPNQGGKTTFSRMFGQLHYLAALGLPIPGREARVFLFDSLFTHFEREEKAGDLHSKLEDDLIRLHAILEEATPRSIVILNEILSSATLQDAIFLSGKVMLRIDELDAICVWVTFIDEIVGKSDKTISMVSEVHTGQVETRTFKIIRRDANGLAYAQAIAEKYRVTYTDLKRRWPS